MISTRTVLPAVAAACLLTQTVATAAQPRKVVAALDTGWRADYHPRFGCVNFYDVTGVGDPNYVMKDSLMFSVWLGYEITSSANKEEPEALTVNPVNGTVYVLCYDSGTGGGFDSQGNDGTGDWDLWRIDYQAVLKDFIDNARPMKTMYIPSIGADGFDYKTYGVQHPGGVYNTVYLDAGVKKIGEVARNGDATASGGANTGGGDFFEIDLDFVDPAKLVVLDDQDYQESHFYADPNTATRAQKYTAAQSDHRVVAIIRKSTDPNQATHDPNQTAAREGGYNHGAAQSWETFDLGLVNMDGVTNDPNLAGYDANLPLGWIGQAFSEPIDMQFVTRSVEGAVGPNAPGTGAATVEGVWLADNDTPASTSDDVDFKKITGWDGGANDLLYLGGFLPDNIADANDNNGDLDWIRVDENGAVLYGESGYYDTASTHYGDEGWSHEPKIFTRSVLDYEYTNGGQTFVWLDPNDFTMHGPIADGSPDDDSDVCDGRFFVFDPGANRVFYFDIDGSPDYMPDAYVYDLAAAAFVHQEVDALGLTDGGAYGELYISKHALELFVRGDVDRNGVADVSDVVRLYELIDDPTDGGKLAADVGKEMYDLTGDNDLTQADVDELVQNILDTDLMTLNLRSVNGNYGAVTVTPPGLDPNGTMFLDGELVTLTAVAIEGKSFNRWLIFDPNFPGDSNYATPDSNTVLHLVMDMDYEVEAAFKCGSGIGEVLPLLVITASICGLMTRRCRRRA
ncbi:MAG: hypothetical protein JXQ73_32125 [Phycisphaerae bacterium]|nr:hypothetical protein [Phycisphaerae bacterium]